MSSEGMASIGTVDSTTDRGCARLPTTTMYPRHAFDPQREELNRTGARMGTGEGRSPQSAL